MNAIFCFFSRNIIRFRQNQSKQCYQKTFSLLYEKKFQSPHDSCHMQHIKNLNKRKWHFLKIMVTFKGNFLSEDNIVILILLTFTSSSKQVFLEFFFYFLSNHPDSVARKIYLKLGNSNFVPKFEDQSERIYHIGFFWKIWISSFPGNLPL